MVNASGRALGLVAAYFNPCGWKSRRRNFDAFYEALGSHREDCLIVELAFGNRPFDVPDAVRSLRFRTDDVLWHKEALLNIGIRAQCAAGYANVGWIDADVVFLNDDWRARTLHTLERYRLCQLFRTARIGIGNAQNLRHDNGQQFGAWGGGGWAMRADLAAEVPLYDRAIVGGFDAWWSHAALGTLSSDKENLFLTVQGSSLALRQELLAWAERWRLAVNGSVSFADNDIRMLPHGTLVRRAYVERTHILHAFDPQTDVFLRPDGVLAWSTTAPKSLRKEMHHYFLSRQEDNPYSDSFIRYLGSIHSYWWHRYPHYQQALRTMKIVT